MEFLHGDYIGGSPGWRTGLTEPEVARCGGGTNCCRNSGSRRDMHYRTKWYVQRGANPLVYGIGIHGQFLFVDPARKLSVAWFASQSSPLDSSLFEKALAAIERIRASVS